VIALVVAWAGGARVIGRDGGLPWHLPSDMKHFKELTTGGTVIMGRRTWESIPERFRPLPERRNIVLSRAGFTAAGAEVAPSLTAALAACEGSCFVIGGGATYAEALPLAGRVYATEVDGAVEGDTFFPTLDPARWRVTSSAAPVQENGFSFVVRVYERTTA
jgi:dihydrofolate reductase